VSQRICATNDSINPKSLSRTFTTVSNSLPVYNDHLFCRRNQKCITTYVIAKGECGSCVLNQIEASQTTPTLGYEHFLYIHARLFAQNDCCSGTSGLTAFPVRRQFNQVNSTLKADPSESLQSNHFKRFKLVLIRSPSSQ
jgi:hypothetical protein